MTKKRTMAIDRPEISVISTYATDRLIDAATMQIIKEQRGGPALYIIKALRASGIEPRVYTGEEMMVEILVRKDGEFGKIHEPMTKTPLPKIATDSAIVSTLLDEWDLTGASEYGGKLFVDIQGYVRDGLVFGGEKLWNTAREIAPFIFCLKGNSIEIDMLPKEVVADQAKNRMLVVTKGKEGVEIFYQGQRLALAPSTTEKPPHTVGAGDTWFANFVAEFTRSDDVQKSAIFALDKTSEFLASIR